MLTNMRREDLSPSVVDRFNSRIDKFGPDGCWIWKGAQSTRGYGIVRWMHHGKRVAFQASRVAWMLLHGETPGDRLLHACGDSSCVNPGHLVLEKHADAMLKRRGVNEAGGLFEDVTWTTLAQNRSQWASWQEVVASLDS